MADDIDKYRDVVEATQDEYTFFIREEVLFMVLKLLHLQIYGHSDIFDREIKLDKISAKEFRKKQDLIIDRMPKLGGLARDYIEGMLRDHQEYVSKETCEYMNLIIKKDV